MGRDVPEHGLDDLRAFGLIAGAGGISAAARRHALPKGSLARAVARLEAAAGTALFDRVGQGLRLTARGERLRESGERAVRLWGDADAALLADAGEPRGALRVGAGAHSGLTLAAPVIAGIVRDWPEVRASLCTLGDGPESGIEDIDVLLSIGRPRQQNLVSRRIVAGTLAPYASNEVAATIDIDDVAAVSRLPRAVVDVGTMDTTWRMEARDGRTVLLDAPALVTVEDPLVAMEVVANGVGTAFLSALMVRHARRGSDLQRLLPSCSGPPIEVYLSFAPGRGDVPVVRAFIDALVARAERLMETV